MAHNLELFFSILERKIDNRGKTPPFSETGYPLIEIKHIQQNRLYPVFEDTKFVDQATWDTWFREHLEPGDILFSTVGSIARSCLVPLQPKFGIAQNVLGFRVNRQKADSRYVYYAINGSFFQQEVHGRTIETVQKSIKVYDLKTCRIPLPSLSEQKAIASVLGALDDKIELNRRMNETLEALAQSLFKSWFVNATQSGLPKGWRESTIGEEVRVVGGSTPSTAKPEFWEGGTHHWATPKDLSNLGSPVLLETERKITDAGVQQISSGLLPVGTVLLSSRAPIGYLVISEIPVAVNQGFIALVCDKTLPNYFVRLWLKNNMEAIEGRANGTTFMEISKTNFRPLPVVVPPPSRLAEFTNQVEPLQRRVVSNLKESRTLAALRDALLPKLLSGELRVPTDAISTDSAAARRLVRQGRKTKNREYRNPEGSHGTRPNFAHGIHNLFPSPQNGKPHHGSSPRKNQSLHALSRLIQRLIILVPPWDYTNSGSVV